MVPELEKPRVTEIQVRMDCNGCVQKIKKALHGINGIYDLYIDFPQQKLTVIGWVDPEKILTAIRKTRKIATICSHSEPSTDPPAAQPLEQPQQPPEGGGAPLPAAPEAGYHPPAEAPPAEAARAEPPKDPPLPENPPPLKEKPLPSPAAVDAKANQPAQLYGPKDVGDAHVIYHHTPNYGYKYGYGHGYGHNYGAYGGQWSRYPIAPSGRGFPPEPSPSPPPPPPQPAVHVTHSYNTYRPSVYVTEYQSIQSPPRRDVYSTRTDHYSEDYHDGNRNINNGSITSIFSDENPNACTMV